MPFQTIDLIIGLPNTIEYDLVSKLLGRRDLLNKVNDNFKRRRCTYASECQEYKPCNHSCCLHNLDSSNEQLQSIQKNDESMSDKSIHKESTANSSSSEMEEVDALQEMINELTIQRESAFCATVQAHNQQTSPHLLSEVDEHCALCALIVHKSELLDDPDSLDENQHLDIETDEPDSLDPESLTATAATGTDSELPNPENIFGSESLQARIKELCRRYSDVFSSKVLDTPAKVEPMTIIVEGSKWKIPASRKAPRPQSPEKAEVLKKMVEDLLRLKVIRVSSAAHASQVLLVVKKGSTKLRFCIDYRELNNICQAEGWPIPNIGELLNRIGSKHAKYFAVMDLTSGYHQAPLSEESKHYTAFVTNSGTYEWNRVPMGLKAAGSYFQRIMQSQVLIGLIMSICECYLDDIITWGASEEEFLSNLEQIFSRLRERKVTLNPAKCKFGMKEIEYVGHVIDEHGITFTRNKLDSVVNFPKPVTQQDLKRFVGLCNYFRKHIRNHSAITQNLQEAITPYRKRERVVWTEARKLSLTT